MADQEKNDQETNGQEKIDQEYNSSSENVTSTGGTRLPLLPLRDIIVFPSTVVPLFVGREKSIRALEEAESTGRMILLAAQKKAKTNKPSEDDIFEVGTIAEIVQMLPLPDGTVKVLVEGKHRARIKNFVETERVFLVDAEVMPESGDHGIENEALVRTVKTAFDNYVRLNKRIAPEMLLSITGIEDESKLADTLVAQLNNLKLADKQRLLEQTESRIRLEELYGFIQSEIEIMRVEKRIRARVKRQMEKTQKEYYLNEQMQAIQKELGERDDGRNELADVEKQIKERKLSKEAREKLTKEFKKLKQMSPMSAEATVVRNYIDTVLGLPWGEYSEEGKDTAKAKAVLDEDHYGLEKIKDRIIEYLSVSSLVETPKGPILCLVGPPGVGKTSLARSVAKATGREFVRMSLGGVSDEAEIRGHRRTYIGAMPGKIIRALKRAKTSNPVILLDEIDKLGRDHRGDPSAALLEVLDPQQNNTFQDHYLDLDYDLSRVLFLATANSTHTIPGPLLDRLEMIQLSGYTEEEKTAIASQYLVARQQKETGLADQDINFDIKAVRELIQYYTREAGVRSLEREIGSVFRKLARKHLDKHFSKSSEKKSSTKKATETEAASTPDIGDLVIKEKVTDASVRKYLGPRRYRIGLRNDINEIGICMGLAWTQVGGDLLEVEVATFPGNGKLRITGKLGEVMQESAHAAWSYVRTRADFLGLDTKFYEKLDVHIHVPEGAIPKDGPSAGICMATALTSAITGRPVNRFVAMTGEITLRGRVLPIGGLKEKLLAAHRGGIEIIVIPEDNRKDIEDIPKNILKNLTIHCVKHMDEVLIHALAWDAQTSSRKKKDDLLARLQKITAQIPGKGSSGNTVKH